MLDALMAHVAMEVRTWYPAVHHDTAERILKKIEEKIAPTKLVQSDFSGPKRVRTRSGGSFALPARFDSRPEAHRKPFIFIGEQQLQVYFKWLPVQMVIWSAKCAKRVLLKRWGF